jgi:hypothetical protein
MVEAGNILGALAAALLLMAVIAWVRLFRGQRMRRTGGRIEMESADGEFASELLFWAAALSGGAVFFAVAGWIFK